MESCKKTSSKFLLLDNVVLHVLILFSLLSILFMFYISKITTNEINNQFNDIVNGIDLSDLKDKHPEIYKILESFNPSYFDKIINNFKNNPDPLRESINDNIFNTIYIIIGFLLFIAVLLNILPFSLTNFCLSSFKHLGYELITIFAFVGLIEYWFFTNIASKYIPVKPDVLIESIKERMINKTS